MTGSVAYLDTSAFVKLIVAEPETPALRGRVRDWPVLAAATLLRTETARALRRAGYPSLVGTARRMYAGVHFLRLDEPLLDRAGDLEPTGMRSLDAVHLAAALSLGTDLGVLFTYDKRMSEAAALQGIDVESPG